MENKVTISIWEYEQFIKASEQIRIIKRMVEQQGYVSVDEINAILGTPKKEKAVQDG